MVGKKVLVCFYILAFCVIAEVRAFQNASFHDKFDGPFMNMQETDKPLLLMPKALASSLGEYNGTFSPDGKLFYYTSQTRNKGYICYTVMNPDGSWSKSRISEFSSDYSEYDPLFAPDGKRLYFSSERPLSGKNYQNATNIWYVEKLGNKWGEAKPVELGEGGNYYSSMTNSGKIYFNRWKNGGLFTAELNNGKYVVEKLPAIVDSQNDEGDPFIAPDESYIIFRAYNNSLGMGDLFISFNFNGEWTSPENLGAPINSSSNEMCPYVTLDGKFFIFSSSKISSSLEIEPNDTLVGLRNKNETYDNGSQNIYYISADFIGEMRAKHK